MTRGFEPTSRRWSARPPILVSILCVLAASACASRAPLPLRPEPVAWADTLPAPEPDAREAGEAARLLPQILTGQTARPFDLRRLLDRRHPAQNVTRHDDVVGSSWFEHRIGTDTLSPERLVTGYADAPPDSAGPLTVVAGKSAGISPGFTVEDARGRRYLFKFDPKGHLHLASTADVVSARLLWAAGYHVPEDYKVAFDADRLELAPDAELTTAEGGERAMRRRDVRRILDRTDTLPDGRYLALASRFVPGEPKGPFYFAGRRADDPNDHYQHQHRRELRGLYVLAAWLNHVDIRYANTMTTWVEPGYLRHYLIDFGATLGSGTIRPHEPREGTEYNVDFWRTMGRLLSLGFYRAGWEGREPESLHPMVGWMPVLGFDPGGWQPNWPNPAFWSMTPRDAYWAAKLVASFSDAHVRAAVRAGDLPDPAAADTLVDALVHRRDATVAHWYARVTPLEAPEAHLHGGGGPGASSLRLSFRDLGLEEGLWRAGQTTYRWRLRHPSAGVVREGQNGARRGDEQRIEVELPASLSRRRARGEEDLATLEVTAERPDATGREAVVHLRWKGPERGYRVVGLEH